MREIKFRAWDRGTREFVDDVLIAAKHGFLYQNWNKCEFSGEDRDIVIMQYTGLKDKNGKEIYEGDVLETMWSPDDLTSRSGTGPVTYRGDGFYIGLLNLGMFCNTEIIGNIYENPELSCWFTSYKCSMFAAIL